MKKLNIKTAKANKTAKVSPKGDKASKGAEKVAKVAKAVGFSRSAVAAQFFARNVHPNCWIGAQTSDAQCVHVLAKMSDIQGTKLAPTKGAFIVCTSEVSPTVRVFICHGIDSKRSVAEVSCTLTFKAGGQEVSEERKVRLPLVGVLARSSKDAGSKDVSAKCVFCASRKDAEKAIGALKIHADDKGAWLETK